MKTVNFFAPPRYLRNRHLQSIIASIKLRRPLVKRRASRLLACSTEVILPCREGVRLQGYFSGHSEGKRDLAVMIHGWEGSSDSMYLLSAAGTLFRKGFNVFRLNLRDHGTSHHLNREPFHSCRLNEVLDALEIISREYGGERKYFLCGFSLGGNFALRAAVKAPEREIPLDRVVAVCPVLHPPVTMESLESGPFFYQWYFIRKWKQSLFRKQALFPDDYSFDDPEMFRSLLRMTEVLVDRYTAFPDAQAYLNGYSLIGDALKELRIPSHIIFSRDDPVIPYGDLARVARTPYLDIIETDFGGHCGFIRGLSLKSWIDDSVVDLMTPSKTNRG